MEQDYRKIQLVMDLRRQGVSDARVLSAIERVPREAFVDEPFATHAYEDKALPIACGQSISQPLVVGTMTQALELGDRMRVLEIGTGSGYQTAVLAQLARRVYTVERFRPLLRVAEQRFEALGFSNVTTKWGDGMEGWADQAPFERIICTAAAAEIPQKLVDQLKPDGILVLPVGPEAANQSLLRIKRESGRLEVTELMGVRFVPLLPGLARDT